MTTLAPVDSVALHSGEYVERYLAKPLDRVRALASRMNYGATSRIADFGCGNGMLLHALDRPYGAYHGIDFSPDFIAAAERWAADSGCANYRFHLGDIREFCASHRAEFDIATTLDFSEHVEDGLATEVYAGIRSSLRPGGRLYLHTPNLAFFLERAKAVGIIPQFPEHIAVRDAHQTVALLAKAGFDPARIRVQVIPHYNVLKVLHPLSRLPLIGELFGARLWIEAEV